MVHANKSYVELMDWLYVQCGQIAPGDLMQNQEEIQATYNVKNPIDILFYQIDTGQESAVAGTSPFSDRQLAEMGVANFLSTQ